MLGVLPPLEQRPFTPKRMLIPADVAHHLIPYVDEFEGQRGRRTKRRPDVVRNRRKAKAARLARRKNR